MSSGKCKSKQWDTIMHLLEWPKSRTLTTPNAGKDVEQQELSFIIGRNAKWCSHFVGSLAVFYKNKHIFTILSSNHTSWYLPKDLKTYVYTKTCTMIFIAYLLIVAKTWKQPRCPWMINKLLYIQTMEYYSALKRNGLPSHEKTWRNFKCIFLSERSQSEKAMYYKIPMWHSGESKLQSQ